MDDVTGSIPSGGVTAVVGPSGAGKSTLLRLCNRLEVPDSGTVRFCGEDVSELDPLELRRKIGMVFQRPTPFSGTVDENLRVAEPTLTRRAAVLALRRVELDPSFLDRDASELSGGEAQRMCLARTLVTRPEVVLMDEPTSSVDPTTRTALETLGRALVDIDVSVVWVTHDLTQMRRVADHVVVMIGGRIAHSAAAGRIESNAPAPVRAFLEGTAA